jgi:hypothetical protein
LIDDANVVVDHAAQVWNPDHPLPDELHSLSDDILGAPIRHLPLGCVHDLHLTFLAWWDEQKNCADFDGVAGEPHFQNPASVATFYKRWSQKWHHRTVAVVRDLCRHICDHYQDCVLHWSMRWGTEVLPQYPLAEKPKELETFNRLKLVCAAALAHGWAMCVDFAKVSQADKQCKNHAGTLALAMLVTGCKFCATTLQFPHVGHTFEDVGPLLSK